MIAFLDTGRAQFDLFNRSEVEPADEYDRTVPPRPISNDEVADVLERVGDLLEAQDANPFRVRAYRNAAHTVRALDRAVARILEREGSDSLEKLPGIGASLAAAIHELVYTGRLGFLERLEGQISPEDLFTTVPGIGEELATRIHTVLGIDTLEELELAAHDGSLESVHGFGPRRVRAVREELASMLSRSSRRRARRIGAAARPRDAAREHAAASPAPATPTVEAILAVAHEYTRGAEAGTLRTIAPRRFNPSRLAWLPILHTERDGWWFTALYSNTPRAHELGKTRDWVVIYFERDGNENQVTVVTEHEGPLKGRRVIRGRESECRDYYRQIH